MQSKVQGDLTWHLYFYIYILRHVILRENYHNYSMLCCVW